MADNAVPGSSLPRFDLINSNETPHRSEETVDATIALAEQSINSICLDDADLTELDKGAEDLNKISLTLSGYPNSGAVSSGHSVIDERLPSLDNDNARGHLLGAIEVFQESLSMHEDLQVSYVDLAAIELTPLCELDAASATYTRISNPPQNLKEAAATHFGCVSDDSEIHVLEKNLYPDLLGNNWQDNPVCIIRTNPSHFHLLLRHDKSNKLMCLRVDRQSTFKDCLQTCYQWLEKNGRSPSVTSHCLLHNSYRLDDLSTRVCDDLKQFDVLNLVKVKGVNIEITYHLDPAKKNSYFVECCNTDYVKEVKLRFMHEFQKKENRSLVLENVWLTYREELLSDNQILMHVMQKEEPVMAEPDTKSLSFNVFIQPADSFQVKIHFKSNAKKHGKSECLIIVVSPRMSVEALWLEVAKIVHREPSSLKLFIDGKKVDANTNLESLLKANSSVVVEDQNKITLTVAADCGSQSNPTSQFIPISVYKQESVLKLKSEISNHFQVHMYCVDLFHNEVQLNDMNSLHSCRLRCGDTLKALIHPHRICLKMRLVSRRWVDIVVNNMIVSTVGHLKAFAAASILTCKGGNSDGQERQQNTCAELTVIFNGEVLSDNVSLREAGLAMYGRVIVLEKERLCYTATFGRIPIYECKHNGEIQKVLAMSDGDIYYYAVCDRYSDCSGQGSPQRELVISMGYPVSSHGLQLCPSHLKEQFSVTSSKSQQLSSKQSQKLPHNILKSASLPQISRAQTFADLSNRKCNLPSDGIFNREVDVSCMSTPTKTDNTLLAKRDPSAQPLLERRLMPLQPVTQEMEITTPKRARHQSDNNNRSLDLGNMHKSHQSLNISQTKSNAFTDGQSFMNRKQTFGKGYNSDTESSVSQIQYNMKIKQHEDGSAFTEVHYQSLGICSPEDVKSGAPQFLIPLPPTTPVPLGMLPFSHQIARPGNHQSSEKTFEYVSRDVIIEIAHNIGGDWNKLMLELKINNSVIYEAEEKFKTDPFRRSFHCLQKWCESNGSCAKVGDLINALLAIERRDIVESIDNIQKARGNGNHSLGPAFSSAL